MPDSGLEAIFHISVSVSATLDEGLRRCSQVLRWIIGSQFWLLQTICEAGIIQEMQQHPTVLPLKEGFS